jgi:hypothetical protein
MSYYMKFALTFLLLAISVTGCSSRPIEMIDPIENAAQTAIDEGRISLGTYSVMIDTENMEATVLPKRQSAAHFDVLEFMLPPACYNCFAAHVIGYDPYGNSYSIKLGLRNYSTVIVYDPRGIVAEDEGYALINPSGYFRIDTGGMSQPLRFGYVDFKSELMNNMWCPGYYNEYTLAVSLPLGEKLYELDFTIDACYPSHCKEIYEMERISNTGSLSPSGGTMTVRYSVFDWQNDIYWVKINATPLDGGWITMTQQGSSWRADLHNTLGKPTGMYHLEAAAYSPNARGIILYDYFDVYVGP